MKKSFLWATAWIIVNIALFIPMAIYFPLTFIVLGTLAVLFQIAIEYFCHKILQRKLFKLEPINWVERHLVKELHIKIEDIRVMD